MRPVHLAGWATHRPEGPADEAELVAPVVTGALERAGLARREVGFWCSGSCDYLVGRPFSFVAAVDGLGAWPPISESHVEMDGAWALYEAWLRLQHGDVDTAVVYAFGLSTAGDPAAIAVQGLDPYVVAPLAPPPSALAGLQARAAIREGLLSEDAALSVMDPPPGDGSAAVVLSTRGGGPLLGSIAHVADAHELGARDLARPPMPDVSTDGLDRLELHLLYRHEEAILRSALQLPDGVVAGFEPVATTMVDGLLSFVRAAEGIASGRSRAVLAHAQSGPCLQHNLLARVEAP